MSCEQELQNLKFMEIKMGRLSKFFLGLFLCTAFVGCAQNTWFKPNAGNGEFERDRYDCLQQSQQRVGAAQVNAYAGSAVNTVVTNEKLFSSCMGARGWRFQNKEVAQNQMAQVSANQDSLKQRFEQVGANIVLMCGSAELSEYYKKTACKAPDISFEHIADSTKITSAQKAALVKQRERVALGEKEQDEIQAQRGAAGQKIIDVAMNFSRPENEKNNLDLYNGKITWGEYNKRRKEIYLETLSRYKN